MTNNKIKRAKADKEISPITLKLPKATWEAYKSTVSRGVTLNNSIVRLICKEIMKKSRPATAEEINEFLKPNKKGRPENRYSAVRGAR